jgi:hypothetical protein
MSISYTTCSNIYTRRVLAGEFQVVCPWLLRELVDLKLWNDDMKNRIIANNGSIQAIPEIPTDVKAIYKTVWEISQKKVLDLAADRGAFICQSQSSQRAPAGTDARPAHEHAFLRLEARSQDGHVLPPHAPSCTSDAVHCRPCGGCASQAAEGTAGAEARATIAKTAAASRSAPHQPPHPPTLRSRR